MTTTTPPPATTNRTNSKRLRNLLVAAGVVAGLLATSTITNLALERTERAAVTPYGERVQISGGAINVYRTGGAGETIVLLSGLGGAAPAIEFALNFLASDKPTWTPELLKRNEDRLADVPHQKIVVLNGDHYLHYTHSREMAEEITAFLNAVN